MCKRRPEYDFLSERHVMLCISEGFYIYLGQYLLALGSNPVFGRFFVFWSVFWCDGVILMLVNIYSRWSAVLSLAELLSFWSVLV